MTGNPELAALGAIVEAAVTPSGEAVVALAIALASPWMGGRRDIRDRPNKSAPTSDRDLVRFLDDVRGRFGEPLPTDRGPLAWLRHENLAVPVTNAGRAPAWLTGDALAGGWLCRPPRGAIRPDTSMLSTDGRLAMLSLLVGQCPDCAPDAAVTAVCEWFAGIRCAWLTTAAAEQCPAMTSTPAAERGWYQTASNVPIETVVAAVRFGLPVGPDWVHVPTAAEIAEQAERERILAKHLVDEAAWQNRGRARVS